MLAGTAVLSLSQCELLNSFPALILLRKLIQNSCACQPLAGKIYRLFSLKWAFLTFLGIFEVGSLICATSPSSVVLILGRAVAGSGAAGLFSGALVIIAHTIPLRLRPSKIIPSAK